MRNTSLLFIILLLISACSVNQAVPDWAQSTPRDSQYYIGVGKVSRSDPDYRELASNRAIQDIALQINAQVSASLSTQEREQFGVFSTDYLSQIETSTTAWLSDLQPYDSFESKSTYYVYYRLNKQQYHAQRTQLKNQALAQAADLLDKYEAQRANPAQAIPLLLAALDQVIDYVDMDLFTMWQGRQQNIYNEIIARIRDLPSRIKLQWEPDRMSVVAKLPRPLSLKGTASYGEDGDQALPCASLPVTFGFKHAPISPVFTNGSGKWEASLGRISSPESVQSISVSLDKGYFSKNIVKVATRKLWESTSFPSVSLILEVRRPRLYLDYAFISGFQGGLRESIVGQLANFDIAMADKVSEADFLLNLRIYPKQGEYLSNLSYYTSYGDVQITLLDPASGATINYLESLGVKSGGTSRENAERAVEKDCVKAINDGLLYRLLYDTILK